MILRIALPSPLRRLFDYLPPQNTIPTDLSPGIRVRVPFGRREVVGILISVESHSDIPVEKLRPALEIIDTIPVLSTTILDLSRWVADYYHEPLGEVLNFALPVALREGKVIDANKTTSQKKLPQQASAQESPWPLSDEQKTAIEHIAQSLNFYHTFLVDGVTG